MGLEDLDRIMVIEDQCFTDPWTRRNFEETLEQKTARLFVAETESEGIIGYICIYQSLDEGEIVNVAVAQECRTKGYGSWMVGEAIRESQKEGVGRFFLEVRESNRAGKALYQRLGFEFCGRRRGFYDHPKEDALLMMLERD